MKAQLALRMKYRLAAVRKRHYVPHGSGARARAKFQFTWLKFPRLPSGAGYVIMGSWQIRLSLHRWQPNLGWMRNM